MAHQQNKPLQYNSKSNHRFHNFLHFLASLKGSPKVDVHDYFESILFELKFKLKHLNDFELTLYNDLFYNQPYFTLYLRLI